MRHALAAADGRRHDVILTRSGRNLADESFRAFHEFQCGVLVPFDPDQRIQLVHTSDRLRHALSDAAGQAPTRTLIRPPAAGRRPVGQRREDDSMNPPDALQRLVDIEEIQQLKARYFRLMDTKDWAAFGALFTPDAVMDTDGFVHHGPGAILEFLPKILDGVVTTHHGHMPEITITGPDTATGIWAMFDYLTFPGDGPPKGLRGHGHYHEQYRRVDGVWRIQHLVLTRLRVDPLDGGFPGPDELS